MKKNLNILIAEDGADDQELLRLAFREVGSAGRVNFIDDATSLLEKLNQSSKESYPDIIFLDLDLPKRSGLSLLESLKENTKYRHIPVVIFSASSDPKDIGKSYTLGANAYISKPKNFSNLVTTINKIKNYWSKVELTI